MINKCLILVLCSVFFLNLVCAGEYNNFIDDANVFNNDTDFEIRLAQLEIENNGTIIFMSVKTLGDMSTSQAYSTYAIEQNGINKRGSPEKNVFVLYIEDKNLYYLHTAFSEETDRTIGELLVYNARAGDSEKGIAEAIDYIEGIYKGIIKEGTSYYTDFGEAKICYDGEIYYDGKKSKYFIEKETQSFYFSEQTFYYVLKEDKVFSNPVVGGVTMSGVIVVDEKYKMKDKILHDIDGKELAKGIVLEQEKVSLKRTFRFYDHLLVYYDGLRSKYYIAGKNIINNKEYEIWMEKPGLNIMVGKIGAGGVLLFNDKYKDADMIARALHRNYAFDGCQIRSVGKSEEVVAKS